MLQVRALTTVALGLVASSRAFAVDFDARATGGVYTSKETPANDQEVVLGRAYLDVRLIGPLKNQFTFDFRDKYDAFGAVDKEHLVLVAANDPQLRQLAYKAPYENGGLYWSVGRFTLADAGLAAHDGVEAGYRLPGGELRFAAFGGLVAERRKGRGLQLATDEPEGGAYAAYEKAGKGPGARTYIANGVVAQKPRIAPATAVLGTKATGDAPALAVFDHVIAIHEPDTSTRLTAFADVYAVPAAFVRDALLSAFRRLSPALSFTAQLLRFDLTEYLRQRDVRETLAPSAYTMGKLGAEARLQRRTKFVYAASYGARSVDGKSRIEGTAGLVASPIGGEHVEASARFGLRKNFESRDTFARFGVSYFHKRFDLDGYAEGGIEDRGDGTTLHPLTAAVDAGFLATRSVLASLALEYAKDERVSILSAMAMVGWHMGSRGTTPGRSTAPGLEGAQ